MDGLRSRLTAKLVDGLIHLRVEWVEVVGNQPGEVKFTEEFKISPERAEAGCAWYSRVVIGSAAVDGGSFWTDEAGNRHFILSADPGSIVMLGEGIKV